MSSGPGDGGLVIADRVIADRVIADRVIADRVIEGLVVIEDMVRGGIVQSMDSGSRRDMTRARATDRWTCAPEEVD